LSAESSQYRRDSQTGEIIMRTEDGHIIYKCLNEDSTAFGLLVDKYKASIFSIAYSMLRNFHDAEDVTQDVFIKAYKNLSALRRWDNFLSWLCSIAYNLCRDRIKAQSIRKENERLNRKSQKELDDSSVNSYREEQVFKSLHEALDSLPDIYREVLTLHYLGGISSEQIARILSIPYATVRQRLSRARTQLREEILTMISETYEQQRLKASFTFRIVEMVKRIKVNPVSTMKGLPWGLSLATGIMIAVMILNPYVSWFSQINAYVSSVLPSETKVLKIGEIPVDIVKTSSMAILSSEIGKGNGEEPIKPDSQNAFFLAPQGDGGTWAEKANMPTARTHFSTSVVDGKIYAIGGYTANGNTTNIEEYDPKTDKWTKKSDISTGGTGIMTAVVNEKIYAFGDASGADRAVEVYDPKNDTWTKKGKMLTPRGNSVMAVLNDEIYIIGGYSINKCVANVEVYDPKTDTWKEKKDMPTPTTNAAGCIVNDKIYVIGGATEGQGVALNTVWEYDPKNDTWSKKLNMITAKTGISASVVKGKIYIIGGDPFVADIAFSSVEKYDPQENKWESLNDMPQPTMYYSSTVVNDKIYIFGGTKVFPLQPISNVEEYTPEDLQSSISPNGKLPTTWGEMRTAMNR
jgi:RNA polymerase sigma factor (sigma-70 family)